MTPYAPSTRTKRSDISFFGPLMLFFVAFLLLAATLPLSGVQVQIPGIRRVTALLDSVPYPGKPARPVHVPLPDESAAAAALPAAPASTAAAAPQTVVQPVPAVPAAPAAAQAAAPAVAAPPPAAAPAVNPILAAPLPPSLRLENFRHQWQTWNNCGPATITMATSHFGRAETQAQAAPFIKPNSNDKNTNPDELVAYVRTLGLRADVLVAGDLPRLKRFLANDIPVVVEMWFTPHPNDGMGHYRLLVGYDDATQQFTFYDSYQTPGVNVRLSYATFEEDWRAFNRTYIPVYTAEKASVVDGIIGTDRDEAQLKQRSLAAAQAEVATRASDAYAWFNLGSALTATGRTAEAVQAFDRARSLRLPWRFLWYQFAPFEAYLAEGRLADVLSLANTNLQQSNDLEESHYFRGRALEAQGQREQARAAYQTAIRFNPKFAPAQHALGALG